MRRPITVLMVLLLALALGPAAGLHSQSPAQGRKFALLVGVNEYRHPDLKTLKYAENDVTELAQLLKENGYEVILLCDAEGKKNESKVPSKDNIEKHFQELLAKCKTKGDTMLVAFAGHGLQVKENAFFCPVDAKPSENQTKTLISLTNVFEEMQQSYAGVKVVLIDACRGDLTLKRGPKGATSARPPRGVAAFFSCSENEMAYEDPQSKHGVFFHYVLEGLKGKARNDRGEVDLNTLAGYVSREVSEDVPLRFKGEGAQQSPNQIFNISGSPVLIAKMTDDTKPGKIYENTLGMKFAWIPAGKFTMGSPPGEKDRQKNETPHDVTLTKGFYMGIYPVTQGQWRAVMGDNPSWFKNGDDYPVEHVSWEDCQKFVKKLRERDGKEYRLPTEAEWEYACRAGTTTAYYTGDGEEALDRAGWYFDNWGKSAKQTHIVGKKEPNKWGLYDMHGNVRQWCEDWYGEYQIEDNTDPKGSKIGKYRVLRGGRWNVNAGDCRAAFRSMAPPDDHSDLYGFRVVLVSSPRTP